MNEIVCIHRYKNIKFGNRKSISDVMKRLVTELSLIAEICIQQDIYKKIHNNNAIVMTQTNMMRLFASNIDESNTTDLEYFKMINIVLDKQEVQKAFY